MRKYWVSYVVTGVIMYIVFLVATVPAAFVAKTLMQVSRGMVALTNFSGSVWGGEGEVVVHMAPRAPVSLGQGRWRVNPFALFLGRAQVSLDLDGSGTRALADIGIGISTTRLANVDIRFPADLVENFYAPAALVGPAGEIHLTAPEVDLAKDGVNGHADLLWSNAGSAFVSGKSLGDYRLKLMGSGKNVNLKLSTEKGDLMLSGDGSWSPMDGSLLFGGVAQAHSQSAGLEPLLNMLGPPKEDGRRTIQIKTKLPVIF